MKIEENVENNRKMDKETNIFNSSVSILFSFFKSKSSV